MDFFAHQDRARASSKRMVALYLAAVLAVVVSLNLVAFGVFWIVDGQRKAAATVGVDVQLPVMGIQPQTPLHMWWQPKLYAITTLATIAVIGLATAYKQATLGGDGAKVAEMLGGREVDRSTGDPLERRFINVVDEMSIASGVPVPRLFVMDNEKGINAFAAGMGVESAVIGVTRGCLETLNRDQLQGVIAHEFSHILNGDMRLNIRLLTLNFGILVIGLIGWMILRFTPRSAGRSNNRNGGGAVVVIILVAVAMMIVGFVGTFFGKLIQAAVSRQREFLADASAVQFTRNPSGISGALRVIAGANGSEINHPEAGEAAHMFFASGVTSFLSGLFATHPPLPTRIARIESGSAGRFTASVASGQVKAASASGASVAGAGASGFAGASQRVIDSIGVADAGRIAAARSVLAQMPADLDAAVRDPYHARSVVLALLVDPTDASRRTQLDLLASTRSSLAREVIQRSSQTSGLRREQRLPLLELAMPALKSLSPSQIEELKPIATMLVSADKRVSTFELAVINILEHELSAKIPESPRFHSVSSVADAVRMVVAMVASSTGRLDASAYGRGMASAGLGASGQPTVTLQAMRAALDQLRAAAPSVQKRVVEAVVATARSDEQVTSAEIELVRAVCASFGVPLPLPVEGR
jgi:Zn-dependent protease with chaperone function